MNDLISERHTSSCEIRGMPPSCSSVYYLPELRNPVYFTGSTPSVQTGYLIILHGYTIPKCIRSFNDFIIRDGVDARSLAEIKRRRIGYTLSIYFGVATTQMRRIFAKGAGMRAKDSVYYPDGWDKFIATDSKIIQKGSLFS